MINLFVLTVSTLFMFWPIIGMRHSRIVARNHMQARAQGHCKMARMPGHVPSPLLCTTVRHYSGFEGDSPSICDEREKRQKAWRELKEKSEQRVQELKRKAVKHKDLATKNTHYARTYEELADIETYKFELFQVVIEKMSAAQVFEMPDLENENQLMEEMRQLSAKLQQEIPEDKI